MSCIFIPLNRLVLYFLFSVLLSHIFGLLTTIFVMAWLRRVSFLASRLIYSYSYTYCLILYSRCLRYLSQIWGSARQRKSTTIDPVGTGDHVLKLHGSYKSQRNPRQKLSFRVASRLQSCFLSLLCTYTVQQSTFCYYRFLSVIYGPRFD